MLLHKEHSCPLLDELEKGTKKIPQDLVQVHHQEDKNDLRLACLFETAHNSIKAITSFTFSKFSLNRVSIRPWADIPALRLQPLQEGRGRNIEKPPRS